MKNVNYSFFFGFTLAEILVTLGIIGIVAAMTIPTLLKNTNDAEYKNAWKKIYSTFTNATSQIMIENGYDLSTTITASDDTMRLLYKPFLKVGKPCAEPNVKGICWHNDGEWYLLDKTPVPATVNGVSALLDAAPAGDILQDGTLVRYVTYSCSNQTASCGYILVDVNGFKKPNTVGRDIYGMRLFGNKLLPFGASGGGEGTTCDSTSNGFACGASYLLK